MKAATFSTFGLSADVLVIEEIEKQVPEAGQVLVRLKCSSINPSDVKKRGGSNPALLNQGFVIPHSDGAGIIESVGAGVDESRVGERVWVFEGQHRRRFGTAAQYIAIDSRRAPVLPENVDFQIGASLGIPVMTAHRCVFADGPVQGKSILVTGGAGRVGYYAIQWAAKSGANVIATASNEQDKQICLQAGARAVVNHRDPEWPKHVLEATNGEKIDRVVEVEFGANLAAVLDVINIGGVIATYSSMLVKEPPLPFYKMMFMCLTIQMVLVYDMSETAKQSAIDDINVWLAAGKLTHRKPQVFPLTAIASAHEAVETAGARGSVILSIP